MVLDPQLRNRIAIAHAKPANRAAPSLDDAVAGLAIWAKISPEVDAKIREQIKVGVFPVRLRSQEWDSGEIAWVLDVFAPNPKRGTAVMTNMKQLVGDGTLFAHPSLRGLTSA